MLDQITAEQFGHCNGEPLRIVLADREVALQLEEAIASSLPSPRAATPFRASLLAESGFEGGQGTYRVRHPVLGEMDLFLVPIARADGRVRFEAVFN